MAGAAHFSMALIFTVWSLSPKAHLTSMSRYLAALFLFVIYCSPMNGDEIKELMDATQSSDPLLAAYANVSTAPALICVRVHDIETGRDFSVILENTDLAEFLFQEKNKPPQEFTVFVKNEYVPFMQKHVAQLIPIHWSKFVDHVARRFASRDRAAQYLQKMIFNQAYELSDLGAKNEEELLRKYFDDNGWLKSEHQILRSDPRFIALMINLGYVVVRGDYLPNLHVRKGVGQVNHY